MKIGPNPSAAINAYSQTAKSDKPSVQKGKTDTVAISGKNFDAKSFASSVAAEIFADTAPARISTLQKSVEDGSYNITSQQLADALIDKM